MMTALIALLLIPFLLGIISYVSPAPRLSQALTVVGGLASLGLAGSLVGLGNGQISYAGGLLYADSLSVVLLLAVALEGTGAALEAAWKYVLIASAGLALALLAVVLLYASGTSVLGPAYEPNWTRLLEVSGELDGDTVRLAFIFAVIGFGTKAGLVPMHTWLPDAHSEGPTPVSALLSGALLADAMYAVFRFYGITVHAIGPEFPRTLLFFFGLASLTLAGFFVLIQRDFKRLLAYSSIEHMGVLAVGAAFGTSLALYGVALHILTHAATKSMAFFGAGSILRKLGTKETAKVRGLIHLIPATAILFLIAGLALSGLPPFGIFRSEFLILAGGFSQAGTWFILAAVLLILVNLAFLGLFRYANLMTLDEPPEGAKPGEASKWMVAAMAVDLIFVLGLGVWVPDALSVLLDGAALAIGGT